MTSGVLGGAEERKAGMPRDSLPVAGAQGSKNNPVPGIERRGCRSVNCSCALRVTFALCTACACIR